MVQGWRVIEPPTSGAAESYLKKLSSSMIGQQPQHGAIISEMKKMSASMTGKVPNAGPLASNLKPLAMSAFGTNQQLGVMSSSTKKMISDMVAPGNTSGIMSSVTQKMLVDMAGKQIQSGQMDSRLAQAIANLAGQHAQNGQMNPQIAKLIHAMQGQVPTPVFASSTGAGGMDDTLRNNKTLTYIHTVVPGNSQRMYCIAASGHSVWVNPSAFTFSTTVDDIAIPNNWTLVGTRLDYGNDSGWRLGHIALYEYINPPPGVWAVTVMSSVGSQGIHRMYANSRVYDNVGSTEQWVTQVATSTNATVNLTTTPAPGDRVLYGGGYNASPVVTSPLVTAWDSAGSTRNGDLDYWDFRDAPGEGVAVPYLTSSSQKLGAFGLVLKKVA